MDVASSDDEFSMDPGSERETDEAALRAALHFSVGEICSAETSGKPMSGAAVSTLSEVSECIDSSSSRSRRVALRGCICSGIERVVAWGCLSCSNLGVVHSACLATETMNMHF